MNVVQDSLDMYEESAPLQLVHVYIDINAYISKNNTLDLINQAD